MNVKPSDCAELLVLHRQGMQRAEDGQLRRFVGRLRGALGILHDSPPCVGCLPAECMSRHAFGQLAARLELTNGVGRARSGRRVRTRPRRRRRRAPVPAPGRRPSGRASGSTTESASSSVCTDRLGDERAEIALRSGGVLFLDRAEARAEFVTPEPMTPDELAHPGLAPVAAVTARWLGRQSFHAGAFVLGRRRLGPACGPGGRQEHDAGVARRSRASDRLRRHARPGRRRRPRRPADPRPSERVRAAARARRLPRHGRPPRALASGAGRRAGRRALSRLDLPRAGATTWPSSPSARRAPAAARCRTSACGYRPRGPSDCSSWPRYPASSFAGRAAGAASTRRASGCSTRWPADGRRSSATLTDCSSV